MKRFEASGWRVLACDGHDPVDIERALTDAATGKAPMILRDGGVTAGAAQ